MIFLSFGKKNFYFFETRVPLDPTRVPGITLPPGDADYFFFFFLLLFISHLTWRSVVQELPGRASSLWQGCQSKG